MRMAHLHKHDESESKPARAALASIEACFQPETKLSLISFPGELERLLADDVPHGDLTTEALGIGDRECSGLCSIRHILVTPSPYLGRPCDVHVSFQHAPVESTLP